MMSMFDMRVSVSVTLSAVVVFFSGRTVVYRSHYKRPQLTPKIDFGGTNYRLQCLMLRLMLTGRAGLCWRLDRPGRTPSTCVAWQLQHWWLCVCVSRIYVQIVKIVSHDHVPYISPSLHDVTAYNSTYSRIADNEVAYCRPSVRSFTTHWPPPPLLRKYWIVRSLRTISLELRII